MKDKDWETIPNFERKEFDDPLYPGSGNKASRELILNVVAMRLTSKAKVITHAKVGGAVDVDGSHGHEKDSYHLLKNGACALDFHFDTDIDPRVQVWWVLRCGYRGIGIYYHWHWNGILLPVGFHVDERPPEKTQIWVESEKGKRIYLLR